MPHLDDAPIYDGKGEILVGSADNARDNLAVGVNRKLLKAASAETLGLKWDFPSFIGARIYKSANQTLTTGTVTALTMNSEDYDTDAFHSTVTNDSRITIPSGLAGYYLVLGTVQYAPDATGERRARLHKNGSVVKQNNKMTVTVASENTFVECTGIFNLAETDYIELNGYHTKGSDLAVVGGSANTQLIVQFLGV